MRFFFSIIAILVGAGLSIAEENWPQFRGPGGNGISDSSGLPLEWSETKNIVWKTPIHGRGFSSPVVWADQIWMTTATEDGKRMFGICVDLETGEITHNILIFENENPRFRHAMNSYASPTPVIEAGRVYLHFGSYGTVCLDTKTAETLWSRRDLHCDHFRGPGSSPILFGDLLFAIYDGFDQQYVVALDKNTGKTVWKRDRNIEYGTDNGDRKKAYCTPQVVEYGGRTQLICPSAVASISYAPLTGEELWRVRHGGMNAAARPIFGHGMVYITTGDGKDSLIAVRPDGAGHVTDTHIQWKLSRSVPKRSSQLLLGELLFMIDDAGIASCVQAPTGRIVWQKRIGGEFWASPVCAEGRIYCFSKDGTCPVIKADRQFELLAKNELDDGFNASPAIVGESMILRTFTHLYCIRK